MADTKEEQDNGIRRLVDTGVKMAINQMSIEPTKNITHPSRQISNSFRRQNPIEGSDKITDSDIFAVTDELVNRVRNGSAIQDFHIFSLDKWTKRCEDAIDDVIDNNQVKEELRDALEFGCYRLTHREDRSKIMNEYEQDREEILKSKYPEIKIR